MKECVIDAYKYYHNPLHEECEKEFKNLPILFGRKRKEEAIREKYKQKGLKVVRYDDIKCSKGGLEREARGSFKPCATFVGYGRMTCGIDGRSVEDCPNCRGVSDCQKLQRFLWPELFED